MAGDACLRFLIFMPTTLAKSTSPLHSELPSGHLTSAFRSPEIADAPHPQRGALVGFARMLGGGLKRRRSLILLALAVAMTAAGHYLERGWALWLGEHVPVSWVQAASIHTLNRLDANVLTPSSLPLERQNAINVKFAALRIPQGETLAYELVFRRGGALNARAFTLAGGQIVVTDEWVSQFPTDSGLLRALSEQLGHLHNHDALRGSVDHSPMAILIALTRGDVQTGIRLMSEAQPILEHDARCEELAQSFAEVVMQANRGMPST